MASNPHEHKAGRASIPILTVMVMLAAGIISSFFFQWERSVLEAVQPFGDTPAGALFVQAAKYLGNGSYQAVPAAILLFIAWKKQNTRLFNHMTAALCAVAASGIVANILKFVIGKARPGEKLGNWHMIPFSPANDFHSFPSGHTTTSFAMAWVLSTFYPRLAPLFFGTAALIGFGRVAGESHFPSDVMAGAFLGITIGWLTIKYYRNRLAPSHAEPTSIS